MRKLIQSNITTAPGLSIWDLRQLARNEPDDFVHKITLGAEEGKFKLADFQDLRRLYSALADVPVTVHINDIDGTKRAIGTTAFPILVGNAVIAGINEAYIGVETIGQNLVTEFDDNKKVSIIARVEALDKEVDEVKEDMDFPEIGTAEEGVEIRHRRNGRKFTILKEAIEENDIPNIIGKINGLGDLVANRIEELTLKRVYDFDASKTTPAEPYAYRPQSGATALYSATANTPGTKAPLGNQIASNAFVDESDLENARVRLATMLDANGKRITVPRSEIGILCPDAIVGAILKVRNSEYVPGVENELSNWGPRGKWNIPIERIYSSPKCDDLSTGCWLYGAFARQFYRKWKLRFEYVTLGMETQAYLNSRVAFQARLAWDCEVGAVGYNMVIRNLAATTAPGDES